MKRTISILALAAALLAPAAATAAASSGDLRLTPIARTSFPQRGYILDLPVSAGLTRGSVYVTENGRPVRQLHLASTDASGLQFGVVLVIDASESMQGRPLSRALAAARTFVAHRGPNERIGLITFNSTVDVVSPPRSDDSKLAAALATPPNLAHGTHIFDALAAALDQLRGAGVAAGSVVLLSDGADTGSNASEDAVTAQAQRHHVRIFTVGLRSRSFDPATMEELASRTGGAFKEAESTAQLTGIYSALGRRLATEYVLTYRSPLPSNTRVHVRVDVPSLGSATATYTAPKSVGLGAFHRSLLSRFLLSPLSMVVLAFFVAAMLALVAFAALGGKRRNVVARLASFVSVQVPASKRAQRRSLVDHGLVRLERSVSSGERWKRFERALEIARINAPARQVVAATVMATVLAGFVFALISPIFVVAAFVVPLVVREIIRHKLDAVRDSFAEQLPDTLQVLASSLRAGHSFVGALAVVVSEAPDPTRLEFQRVVADEQLGVSIEDGLRTVADRMASRELEQVALVAELQREAGGNMAEVLDTVVETIRERFDLRRLVQTLTAQGRLARWIVSLLPVVLALILSFLNPAYMSPLFNTTTGHVLLVIAAVMVISGSLIIKKIVDIKV